MKPKVFELSTVDLTYTSLYCTYEGIKDKVSMSYAAPGTSVSGQV